MQNKKKLTRAVERRQTKLSSKKLTDQSFKKACDINNIVAKFHKTGILPESNKKPLYADVSNIPSLETSYEAVINASHAFYALPATIRKHLNNDPSQLENFISDEDNRELCYKYGLLKKNTQASDTQKSAIIAEKEVKNDEKIDTGKNTVNSASD